MSPEGEPRSLPPSDWAEGFDHVARAGRERAGWPREVEDRVRGWFGWLARLTRPDGSMIFGPTRRDPTARIRLGVGAGLDRSENWRSVLDRWYPSSDPAPEPEDDPDPPPNPLPARSSPNRALAILRANWNLDGDWLAVDHRRATRPPLLELAASGQPWLTGPWEFEDPNPDAGPRLRPRTVAWTSTFHGDAFEWTQRRGPTRMTRTVVLLRSQGLALIGHGESGPELSHRTRFPLAPRVTTAPTPDGPGLILARGRARARAIPIGWPMTTTRPEVAPLRSEGSTLILDRPPSERRVWLPIVVAWGQVPARWRSLTVSERSRVCPASVAFAARLSWGVGRDGILIYRSLAKPALRTVLGHQTRARFLVGRFTPDGDVVPLVKWD